MIDQDKLHRLEALAKTATKGPWLCWNDTVEDMEGRPIAHIMTSGYGPDPGSGAIDAMYMAAADPETILGLLAEVRRLNDLVKKHIDPAEVRLTEFTAEEGGVKANLAGGAIGLFADALSEQFREQGAVNYLQLRFQSSDAEIGELMVTMQRVDGKTPAEKCLEAEAERDALRRENTLLRALEDGIRHDREMWAATSDEFNPTGTLVTEALGALDSYRVATTTSRSARRLGTFVALRDGVLEGAACRFEDMPSSELLAPGYVANLLRARKSVFVPPVPCISADTAPTSSETETE